MAVGHDHEPEENDRYEGVDGDVLQWIVDGVVFLSHEIGDDHCCAIASKSCPGARHVAVARHEDKVHGNEHGTADAREPCSPDGLVDELVPEGEVEVDAHHDLCRHDDGHHTQTAPVVAAYDVSQDVHVAHHQEEGEQGEDNEIFHRLGVGVAVVLVLRFSEDERLVGVAERLGYHRHDHGNL